MKTQDVVLDLLRRVQKDLEENTECERLGEDDDMKEMVQDEESMEMVEDVKLTMSAIRS